ncbi:SCP2 sterol-binding domain-containing protein, partial [Mycobacterium kansasii]|uniref:SCP2 sterol-binding domain-containing protein n=1 Tax=Mycobacterium kansasii TaxID=1768 RepID=UPI0018DBE7AA
PAPQPTGKRVLVVGAGPSGLSAAYHLARLGHHVEVRDAGAEPGGMMRYGIPSYRLPRDVLDAEIERIVALGVQLVCGHRVDDLAAERQAGNFDAAFVAEGAHLAKRIDIPAHDAGPMIDAVSFLRAVAAGEKPDLGHPDVDVVFFLELRDGTITAGLGEPPAPVDVELRMRAEILDGMFTGALNPMQAAMGGRLSFSGDTTKAMALQDMQADLARLYQEARAQAGDPGDLAAIPDATARPAGRPTTAAPTAAPLGSA